MACPSSHWKEYSGAQPNTCVFSYIIGDGASLSLVCLIGTGFHRCSSAVRHWSILYMHVSEPFHHSTCRASRGSTDNWNRTQWGGGWGDDQLIIKYLCCKNSFLLKLYLTAKRCQGAQMSEASRSSKLNSWWWQLIIYVIAEHQPPQIVRKINFFWPNYCDSGLLSFIPEDG